MIAYLASVALMVIGIYAVLLRNNIIKKIMGLGIFSNGIHLMLISIAYRSGGIPPIMEDLNFMRFSSIAVDPLPQALILTSIVINLSVTAVALSIAILLYREFRTLDARKIKDIWG